MALNEDGARYFEQGRYRLAVERFIHAYALEPDSNLLFNIASCYERLGDSRAAIEKYREFLASPDAASEGRAPAEAAIVRLEARAVPAPPAPGSPPAEAGQAERPQPLIRDERSGGLSLNDALPWATLGSGVVLASLGATFYWLGARDHAQVSDAPGYADGSSVSTLSRADAEELVASGKSKKAVGVTGLALGGGLIAAYGAWMLWQAYGDAGESEASAPALAVTPSSRGGTLTLSGSF